MDNMLIYKQCSEVPQEAKKEIGAGRLKGMTDINPMWRIKKLTEMFGPCGFGWYYEILDERLEKVSTDEVVAFVKINLFVKMNDEWSKPIPGTGGNKLVTKESKGLYVSDECFKMALTDAISVACKSLGVGASVYYAKDRTKYDKVIAEETKPVGLNPNKPQSILSESQVKRLYTIANLANKSNEDVKKWIMAKWKKTSVSDLTRKEYDELCAVLETQKVK